MSKKLLEKGLRAKKEYERTIKSLKPESPFQKLVKAIIKVK